MIKRIHHKRWHKKMKRQELQYVWSKIDVPFTYIDLNDDAKYGQGLSSKVLQLMTKYLDK